MGFTQVYAMLVQYLENQYNLLHKQVKEEKSHDPINRCRKSI